jgi:hypothetical protein
MYFLAKVHRVRRSMFSYYVQGVFNDKLVFEGEVMGVILS